MSPMYIVKAMGPLGVVFWNHNRGWVTERSEATRFVIEKNARVIRRNLERESRMRDGGRILLRFGPPEVVVL